MKKIILGVLLVCAICVETQAQEKGNFWIGGNGAFSGEKTSGQESLINFKLLPELGYQFHENWGVAIQLGYIHQESRQAVSEVRIYENGFVIAPYVRWTYLKGGFASLFLDGGIEYRYIKATKAKDETNSFGVGIKPGVAFNVSERVSLIGKVGFFGYTLDKTGDIKDQWGGAKLNLDNIELGVVYNF
ncbi:MAG: porin family protein [Rikenellaceae bacterium]|nr:porin family protein [Rikenellaceae bacterium]